MQINYNATQLCKIADNQVQQARPMYRFKN